MKILFITDAWHPQINGVVRTLSTTGRELEKMGHTIGFIGPDQFNTVPLPGEGPRILLCTEGSAVLRSESGQRAEIGRGGSCFVSAADGAVSCTGQAHLFLATVGPTP